MIGRMLLLVGMRTDRILKEAKMRKQDLMWLVTYAVLAAMPVIFPAITLGQAQTPSPAAAPAPPAPQMPPSLVPVKVIDLMTAEGSAIFGAQWKTMEAKIVEGAAIANAMPGYKTSYDIQPHAGEPGFDDSSWPIIGAKGLADRRGGGKVSFIWYRASLTIPAKIGDFDTSGATVVLTAYVDDYAEVWVDGQMPRRAGYPSPAAIQGFNMPNRVVLADAAKPGEKFQIAVFGINGPISVAPMNFVWFREAKIEFFR
jgi:gluconolactonase